MLGAVACFACLDASAKWLNRTMDPLQTVSVRYIGSFLLVGAFFNPWTRRGLLRAHSLWRQCARACFLVVATLCCPRIAHRLFDPPKWHEMIRKS